MKFIKNGFAAVGGAVSIVAAVCAICVLIILLAASRAENAAEKAKVAALQAQITQILRREESQKQTALADAQKRSEDARSK